MIITQVYLYVDVRPHERYSIAYSIVLCKRLDKRIGYSE